jgi:hypothetical protein
MIGNCSPVIPAKAGIHPHHPAVIPAKAGIHPDFGECTPPRWIPAFAGMTGEQLRSYLVLLPHWTSD